MHNKSARWDLFFANTKRAMPFRTPAGASRTICNTALILIWLPVQLQCLKRCLHRIPERKGFVLKINFVIRLKCLQFRILARKEGEAMVLNRVVRWIGTPLSFDANEQGWILRETIPLHCVTYEQHPAKNWSRTHQAGISQSLPTELCWSLCHLRRVRKLPRKLQVRGVLFPNQRPPMRCYEMKLDAEFSMDWTCQKFQTKRIQSVWYEPGRVLPSAPLSLFRGSSESFAHRDLNVMCTHGISPQWYNCKTHIFSMAKLQGLNLLSLK